MAMLRYATDKAQAPFIQGMRYELDGTSDGSGTLLFVDNGKLVRLPGEWFSVALQPNTTPKLVNEDNPKKLFGDKKPRLSLLPLVAQLAQEEAQRDGMNKYGEYNWRDKPVEAMTYLDAALRHIQLFINGEEKARDTGVSNLGAVMACCAIVLDAQANDALIDNRRPSKAACDALHDAEKMVLHLRKAQDKRNKARGN